jgi:hypothetical protein
LNWLQLKLRRAKEQLGAEVGALKLRVEVLEQDARWLLNVKEFRSQSEEAPGLSGDFDDIQGE